MHGVLLGGLEKGRDKRICYSVPVLLKSKMKRIATDGMEEDLQRVMKETDRFKK